MPLKYSVTNVGLEVELPENNPDQKVDAYALCLQFVESAQN